MNIGEKEKLLNFVTIDGDIEQIENGLNVNKKCKNKFSRRSQRRKPNEKKAGRVVLKSGQFNLEKWKNRKYRVFPDIVKFYIEQQWRWTLVRCILTYTMIWLIFTGIWWVILELHGDLEPEHLPHGVNSTEWTPCVKEIYGFTSIFLYTVEIHTTVGFGTRVITLECPAAIFTLCLESIVGTITQSLMIGIVFAKLTRPKNRALTLLFSKNAIITVRDRSLCLIFRVGNIRKSRIIAVNVQAYLIRKNAHGIMGDQVKLKLSLDSSENSSFMFPIFVVHTIDLNSPLYRMTAFEKMKTDMEILVVFEGTIESTGQPVQVRSCYTSQEILWGHRFVNMIYYRKDMHGFEVNYSKFDETKLVKTPLCSAENLSIVYKNATVPRIRRHTMFKLE